MAKLPLYRPKTQKRKTKQTDQEKERRSKMLPLPQADLRGRGTCGEIQVEEKYTRDK